MPLPLFLLSALLIAGVLGSLIFFALGVLMTLSFLEAVDLGLPSDFCFLAVGRDESSIDFRFCDYQQH